MKNKTIRTPNDILYHDDCAEIILRNMDKNIVGGAIIDLDDVERCSQYKWGRNSIKGRKSYYVSSRIGNKNVLLHKFIMNYYGNEMCVDHINHNTLDNRKCNLRLVTQAENCANKAAKKVYGIYFHNNRWTARVKENGIRKNIGYYDTQAEAIASRKRYLEEHKEAV